MAAKRNVKPVKDKRIKRCGNPDCIIHKNGRRFEPEDRYCTVCQEPLVYACSRCGEIFESKGIDDIICENCREAIAGKQAKRKARVGKIGKGAGNAAKVAGVAANVVAGPAGKKIGDVAPAVGKVIVKAKPAASAVVGVAKAIKK